MPSTTPQRRIPTPLAVAALLLAASFLLAAPAGAEVVRTLEEQVPIGGFTSFQVKVPVGDVVVTGGAPSGSAVEVRAEIACSRGNARCAELADKLELTTRRSGKRLTVALEGFPRVGNNRGLSPTVYVTLPRRLAFQADIGVGDVELSGLEGEIEIDVGVGDVELKLDADAYGEIELDAGVGDSDLIYRGSRTSGDGIVGSSLEWQGSGRAEVEVDTGVGDIRVELE